MCRGDVWPLGAIGVNREVVEGVGGRVPASVGRE